MIFHSYVRLPEGMHLLASGKCFRSLSGKSPSLIGNQLFSVKMSNYQTAGKFDNLILPVPETMLDGADLRGFTHEIDYIGKSM